MTILAVDDSAEQLRDLVSLLKKTFPNDTVVAKGDALAAGQFCFNHPVDALFAAVKMPRLDGLKLMEFAQHANPNAMLFLLVDPKEEADEAFLQYEADGLLYYPITEEQLLSVLQSAHSVQDADRST